MKIYTAMADMSVKTNYPGAESYPIFHRANAPVEGFTAMLNHFTGREYPAPGVHEDNEGFYVISGEGMIHLEEGEYPLTAGTAILVPAGVPHAIKKIGQDDLVIFIYHFS